MRHVELLVKASNINVIRNKLEIYTLNSIYNRNYEIYKLILNNTISNKIFFFEAIKQTSFENRHKIEVIESMDIDGICQVKKVLKFDISEMELFKSFTSEVLSSQIVCSFDFSVYNYTFENIDIEILSNSDEEVCYVRFLSLDVSAETIKKMVGLSLKHFENTKEDTIRDPLFVHIMKQKQ